jgi:hypothetical protein
MTSGFSATRPTAPFRTARHPHPVRPGLVGRRTMTVPDETARRVPLQAPCSAVTGERAVAGVLNVDGRYARPGTPCGPACRAPYPRSHP